jgi:hypothetical protein
MDAHLKIIGYLNACLGAIGVVACAVILIVVGGPGNVLLINARIGGSASTLEGQVTLAIMIYLLLMAGPLIAVGLGLLRYQEWARNLGIILSIFSFVHFPVGTVVGIYSLWVLTSFEVEPLFQSPPTGPPMEPPG